MKVHVDVLFIGSEAEESFIRKSCEEFNYSLQSLRDVEEVVDSKFDASLIVISEADASETDPTELVQIANQNSPNAFLILFVKKELSKPQFDLLSKYGADAVMLKSEIASAKVDFAINQILQANYVAFKTTDLIPNQEVPFTIYHLLPSRKKFLPILSAGNTLSEKRLSQMGESSELYFHRKEALAFKKFVDETSDRSAKGLAKRCRANFMALRAEFVKLAFELSDQSNRVSFGEGQTLMGKCQSLCKSLLSNLAEFPEAWKIVNSSSVDEFGSLERAPAVAAYAGIFSLLMDRNKIEETMLVALLIDIGSLKAPREVTYKIRTKKEFNPDEAEEYRSIPLRSINMALTRKLALEERIRTILMGVYENADGSGFPKGIDDQKLSIESQIVRLAKEFDTQTTVSLGKTKVSPTEAIRQILNSQKFQGVFSGKFRDIVQKNIAESEHFSKR